MYPAHEQLSVIKKDNNDNPPNNNPLNNNPPAGLLPFSMDSSKYQFLSLVVHPDSLNFWNSNSINSTEGTARLKHLTRSIYQKMKDSFDIVAFVLNNAAVPAGMPSGESSIIQNNIQAEGATGTVKVDEGRAVGTVYCQV